jgi:hypothetical protein
MRAKRVPHQMYPVYRVILSCPVHAALFVFFLLCADSVAFAQVGWRPWVDTGNVANSSPTGGQPPRTIGQLDEVFYTNFSGQLDFWQFGSTPQVVAGGSYANPKCWGAGITTCLASTTTLTPPSGPIKIPPHPSPCTTLDCQVQELPWNEPVNLFWYGVNYVQSKWQSLGPLATGWYTIVADSANVLHALAVRGVSPDA